MNTANEFVLSFGNLTSISVGVLAGVIITSLVNFLLKRLEFRHAFYKEIIQKRIQAHQEIHSALQKFWEMTKIVEPHKGRIYNFFLLEHDEIVSAYHNFLNLVNSNSIWISENTLSELHNLLSTMVDKRSKLPEFSADAIKEYHQASLEIGKLFESAQHLLNLEFDSIFKVKQFLALKINENKTHQVTSSQNIKSLASQTK